jgi:hypothetical protein
VEGPRQLRINPKDGNVVEAIYGSSNWWYPEKSRWEFWRWSMGDATIAIRNPQPFTIVATIKFRLRSPDEREGIVMQAGKVLWSGVLRPSEVRDVSLGQIELPTGETVLAFKSDRPAAYLGNGDPRRLSFSLRDFEIDLDHRK